MARIGNTKKAYDYIYEQIISGKKALGAPISEMEISEILGMSRSPIREALKLLEMQGIIVHYQNRGTFVTDITRKDVEEIFQLRIMIELEALNNACVYMDDEVLSVLKNDIEKLTEQSAVEEYYAANTALHQAIVNYSGNSRMIKFYETISMQIALVNRLSAKLPSHFKESRQKHLAIVEAIIERNKEKATVLLREHLEEVRDKTIVAMI